MERALLELRDDVLNLAGERFERRLAQEIAVLRVDLRHEIQAGDAALRKEMQDGFSSLRQALADQRVELLRWSFLFWIGQVAAMAAMFNVVLRALRP